MITLWFRWIADRMARERRSMPYVGHHLVRGEFMKASLQISASGARTRTIYRALGGFGLLAALASPLAHATSYTFTTVDPAGSTWVRAAGINDNGVVSGWYDDGSGHYDAFLDTGGHYTALSVPGSTGLNEANGINNNGVVAGAYSSSASWLGFTDNNGSYTTINVPSSAYTMAYGINDNGAVVGLYQDSVGGQHGYLDTNGSYTGLDVPGALDVTEARGINRSGTIVGYYRDTGFAWEGFVYKNGSYTALNAPFAGATNTNLLGINNNGVMVGSYINGGTGSDSGFIDNAGTFTSLDVPFTGASNTRIFGINDNGALVGQYYVGTAAYGFIATPVPEPPVLLQMAFGLALMGLRRGRWRRVAGSGTPGGLLTHRYRADCRV